jgi:acylphosphatase
MKLRRVQVMYSGRVQGVGFRYLTKRVSAGFEVLGIVRNLPDGRVELVVEGDESEINAFRVAIRESGLGPMIRNESELWSEPRGDFRGFEIVR